jgi:hypothetical protein
LERRLVREASLEERHGSMDGRSLEFERLILYSLALTSAAAGVLHFSAAFDHAGAHLPWYTALFIAAAEFQMLWGAGVLWRPSRRWLALGVLTDLALILIWVVSRTSGLPLIPGGQAAEPLGFKDVITAVFELTVVAGAGMFTVLPSAGRRLVLPAGRVAFGAVLAVVAVMTVFALTRAPGHSPGGDAFEGHGDATMPTISMVGP